MLVKFEKLGVRISGKEVLKGIDFSIKRGEIVTLIGPNGGGKTSIVRVLIGALKPSEGRVWLQKNIKIGYMPQKIEMNLAVPLRVVDFLRLENDISQEKLVELVEKFVKNDKNSAENILKTQIHDLSGGVLQKILFLRAIIGKPDLLVLDEPTQYMDISGVEEFYRMVEEVRRNNNCAVLLVSHDLVAVMQKSDFVYCINRHICCHGEPESINQHPEYLALFGGRNSGLAIYKHQHDHKH